jgi:tight adherence protein C
MAAAAILAVVAVFGTVAMIVGAVTAYVLARAAPQRRRLERVGQVQSTASVLLDSPANPSLTPEASPFVKTVSSWLPRSPKEVSRQRKRFMRAGYHSLTPMAVYTLGQIAGPVVFGGLALILVKAPWSLLVAGAGALFGWLLPSFVVERLISRRQKVIQNGLPDALDLLIVCLEAGSGMDQAILKVSEELGLAYPPLAEEFRMIITETRAGKPRLDAFRNFSSRTGVEDVRALVAMLVQTDRFGTSVSQALRTHADTSRTKRRQRAEERAAKIGVKLVFPLVFALFPAFFVIALGPAVIKFVQVMFGQVLGQ